MNESHLHETPILISSPHRKSSDYILGVHYRVINCRLSNFKIRKTEF